VLEPEGDNNSKFYWGAATAAYQVEGSPLADGAGSCVWHEFSHTPGTTFQGQNGDTAADHYHKWPQDVELMKNLGLNSYRFSVRWPRVLPEGTGAVNSAGIAFYDRLVDSLLEAGIEPFVTLFHWDLPAALFRRGGWSNPDIANWFGEYASIVGNALGDRVKFWMTLNEPFVVANEGHLVGNHAPGMRNIFQACHSVHHQIRAHVAGFHALKAIDANMSVGLAVHDVGVWPASDSDEDVAAAERAESWTNFPMFVDPLVYGRYPPALESRIREYLPRGYEDDMDGLRAPPDFLGLNYYFGYYVRSSTENWLGYSVIDEPDLPRTSIEGWTIRPEGLHRIITQAHVRYKLPAIYITENGASYDDIPQGKAVHDTERTSYLKSHIAAVLQAKDEGVPVQGYFVWSFLDNFEWALGYSKRFGIVYVDYETQERIVKDSGFWYSELARTGSIPAG
jgi:beta-glucosidase